MWRIWFLVLMVPPLCVLIYFFLVAKEETERRKQGFKCYASERFFNGCMELPIVVIVVLILIFLGRCLFNSF